MPSKLNRSITVITPIAAPPTTTFALITDLPGYNSWLPRSNAYKGTTEVSDVPIQEGSTYIEKGSSGTRYGRVLLLNEEDRHVRFAQPMKMKPTFLGQETGITVDMKVDEAAEGECSVVVREVTLEFPWIMGLFEGRLMAHFETETNRVMEMMKKRLEETQEGNGTK